MTSGSLIAGHWYAAHPRTWGPSLEHDQMLGGGLMLTLAELVGLPFILLVFLEWWRAERLRTAELDARLDREALTTAAPPPVPVPTPGVSPGDAAEPSRAVPEMTRPWWETDQGEIGDRMRRRR
jgi:putative copper resistance protein D